MLPVVFYRENANLPNTDTKIDGIRKSRHEVTPDVGVEYSPTLRRSMNNADCPIYRVKEFIAKSGDGALIHL